MIEVREVRTVVVVVTGTTMARHATVVGIMRPRRAGFRLLLGLLASEPVRHLPRRLRTMAMVVGMVEDILSPMAIMVDMERRHLRLVNTTVVVVAVGTKDTRSRPLPVVMTTVTAVGEGVMAVVAGAMSVVGMATAVDIGVEE